MSSREKPIVIIGGSGHARVLIDSLHAQNRQLIGILDPKLRQGDEILGTPVLGGDEVLETISPDSVALVNGLGVLPGHHDRWRMADAIRQKGYEFSIVRHPSAVISNDVHFESGVQVMAGCVLQTGVKVGRDSVINSGSLIDHDCNIGQQCWISPGVTLCGNVRLGQGVYVGTGVNIIHNISIQDGMLAKAGATIVEDVLSK